MVQKQNKKRIGVVVGRFQPLHPGHLALITTALRENDHVKIMIGSSQLAAPLTIDERRRRIVEALDKHGVSRAKYEILPLPDINDLARWPTYLKDQARLTNKTLNRYYTNDVPSPEFRGYLEDAGFIVSVHKRLPFVYRGPDGVDYTMSSATEIRELHKRLGREKDI